MKRALTFLPHAALLACLCALTAAAAPPRAQQALKTLSEEVARGIRLLEQGDAEGAAKVLREATQRDKRDDDAWHHLGLALTRAGRRDEAREALGRAADLRAAAFNLEINQQTKDDRELSQEEGNLRRARFVAKAAALLESAERLREVEPANEAWGEARVNTLRRQLELARDPKFESTPFRLARLFTKAVIKSRPEPVYPESAGRGVSGVVRLRAALRADGTVSDIVVVKTLGPDFDAASIEAARRIKFKPATMDGRPVSQWIVLEYYFRSY